MDLFTAFHARLLFAPRPFKAVLRRHIMSAEDDQAGTCRVALELRWKEEGGGARPRGALPRRPGGHTTRRRWERRNVGVSERVSECVSAEC